MKIQRKNISYQGLDLLPPTPKGLGIRFKQIPHTFLTFNFGVASNSSCNILK